MKKLMKTKDLKKIKSYLTDDKKTKDLIIQALNLNTEIKKRNKIIKANLEMDISKLKINQSGKVIVDEIIKNIRDESNDRKVIDIQDLIFDMEYLFEAIYELAVSEKSPNIIMTLANTGREKALKIEEHF